MTWDQIDPYPFEDTQQVWIGLAHYCERMLTEIRQHILEYVAAIGERLLFRRAQCGITSTESDGPSDQDIPSRRLNAIEHGLPCDKGGVSNDWNRHEMDRAEIDGQIIRDD